MVYRTPAAVTLTAHDWIQMGLDRGLARESLAQALANLSSERQSASPMKGNIVTLTVDYSLTMEQMIKAGDYDYVNDYLQNNDPVGGKIKGTGIVEVTLELVHWNEVVSTKEAIKIIKERGLELARIEHLLVLGVAHPELQREFPIVALGSVWQDPGGDRDVAYLYGWDGRRFLSLGWRDGDWYERCRFLCVRK